MNRGILSKTVRETWPGLLLFALGLFGVEAALNYLLPTFFAEMGAQWMRVGWIQKMVSAMLGAQIGEDAGSVAMGSIAWVHPIVLSLLWAHIIIFCTRLPAAEIDRGTVDVLLALPASRWQVYVSEGAIWLCSGVLLVACALLGGLWGASGVPAEQRIDAYRLLVVITNLMCMYVAVGGLSYLVSSLSDYRGRAVGVVFAIVLASFLLNFLAQFWEPAQSWAFLGLLEYYKPLHVLTHGAWPVRDMAVLCGCGLVLWTAGGTVFAHRNICTT